MERHECNDCGMCVSLSCIEAGKILAIRQGVCPADWITAMVRSTVDTMLNEITGDAHANGVEELVKAIRGYAHAMREEQKADELVREQAVEDALRIIEKAATR